MSDPNGPMVLQVAGPAGSVIQVDVAPVVRALGEVVQRINPSLASALGGATSVPGDTPAQPAAAASSATAGSNTPTPEGQAGSTDRSASGQPAASGDAAPEASGSATSTSSAGQSTGAQPAASVRLLAALAPLVREIVPRVTNYVTRLSAARQGGNQPGQPRVPVSAAAVVPIVLPNGQIAFAHPVPHPSGTAAAPAGTAGTSQPAAATSAAPASTPPAAQGPPAPGAASAAATAVPPGAPQQGQVFLPPGVPPALQNMLTSLLARHGVNMPQAPAPGGQPTAPPPPAQQPSQPGSTVTSGAPPPRVVIVPAATHVSTAAVTSGTSAGSAGQPASQAQPAGVASQDISAILTAAIPLAQVRLHGYTKVPCIHAVLASWRPCKAAAGWPAAVFIASHAGQLQEATSPVCSLAGLLFPGASTPCEHTSQQADACRSQNAA